MSEPRDEQLDDYDDRRGPTPDPTRRSTPAHPLRGVLIFGLLFAAGSFICAGLTLGGRFNRGSTRMNSANNLKMIGLAIQNYEDVFGELPSNSCDPNGKPLLSWRVHILPFIEQDNLYRRFRLDEPWDGPNNIRLLNQMPRTYSGTGGYGQSMTHYRGFSSPGAVFDRLLRVDQPRSEKERLVLSGFLDSTSETMMVVEAGDAVEWTKPDDLDASPGKPFPKVGGLGWRKVFQVLMADGSVRMIRLDTPEPILQALVTHSGGETLPAGWDNP